jgi:predicted RNase H-like HicB family nuclease
VISYVFRVELVEEEDGRWSAGVSVLPGCATWGSTKAEALRNLRDAVEAYIRDMQKAGEDIPTEATTQVIHEPVVAVTL